MALLTDGNPNDTEALRVYETAILDLAHVETIDLDAKLGLATEEISQEVLDILLGHTPLSYAPAYDYQGSIRRRLGVSDVVVTPQIKRWHALRSLEVIYRDAYNNQLNDRYRAKWDEYRELSRGAKVRAITFGIGLVSKPLPKALGPVIGVTAGPILATTYYVRIGWVSAAGQEGSPSTVTTYQTVDGSLLMVGTTNPPAGAAGWNAYIGLTDLTVALQNSTPLALGQTFQLPATGLVPGRVPGDGQAPDIYVTGGWTLQRG